MKTKLNKGLLTAVLVLGLLLPGVPVLAEDSAEIPAAGAATSVPTLDEEYTEPSNICDELLALVENGSSLVAELAIDEVTSRAVAQAVPKPSVVSRTEWGCPDGQESPRWPPSYYTVSHVVIHHTATPNTDTDWPARVLQIWDYHANQDKGDGYPDGWGDIGYHYLIDPHGVIYEGRAGGDDVRGAHVAGHNVGTMGIGFLGTFCEVEPTSAALSAAEALIAWKCDQRNIDPLGSGTDYAGTHYKHIAGHRDLSATACPGDKLYNLLPAIRQNVYDLISNGPDADFEWYPGVWSEKDEYCPDEPFTNYAKFVNWGEESTYTVYFYLYDTSGELVAWGSESSTLPKNYSVTWTVPIPAPSEGWTVGDWEFGAEVIVDLGGNLAEDRCVNRVVSCNGAPAWFELHGWSVTPKEACPDETVTVEGWVTNVGGETGSDWIDLHIVGVASYVGEEYVTLAPDESTKVVFTGTPQGWGITGPGLYTLRVHIYYQGCEWSDQLEVLPCFGPPEFKLSGWSAYPQTVEPGEIVDIEGYVQNVGGEAGWFVARLVVEGDVVANTPAMPLSPGESEWVSFSHSEDAPGTYSITVDVMNADTETWDDSWSGGFEVVHPDTPEFKLSGWSVYPQMVEPGEIVDIEGYVQNVGGEAGWFVARLMVDGDVITNTPAMFLSPGSTEWVSFSHSEDAPGTYSITVDVMNADTETWDDSWSGGFEVVGDKLPPEVTTYPATDVTDTSATLHGYLESLGGDTAATSKREPTQLSLIDHADAPVTSIDALDIEEHDVLERASKLRRVALASWLGEPDGVVVGDELILDLFPDASYTATIDRVSADTHGTVTVTAHIEACAASYILMSTHQGRTLASIRILSDDLDYLVLYEPQSDEHYLVELDPAKLDEMQVSPVVLPPPPCPEEEMEIEALQERIDGHLGPSDPATIDVMVVYTPAARAWADSHGGGINNVIAQAMGKAELVLDNSETGVSMRLVHSAQVDYDEGDDDSVTHIIRLTDPDDGYMDEVHDWRDQYGADLVALFADVHDVGGVAWLLDNQNGRPDRAFSLTRVQQASWTYTHIHEMGHNMGCHHHKEQTFQPGPTVWSNWAENTWSAGWRWTGQDTGHYCSVMTYESGAYFDDGVDHVRVPYFSNPQVYYQGEPTGHPADGDNAQTIREMKHVIAAYRESAELVSVSFEWGTEEGGPYPYETTPQPMTETGPFSADLTGLNPGTAYYFRAKAVADGMPPEYGAELQFTTVAVGEPELIVQSLTVEPSISQFGTELTATIVIKNQGTADVTECFRTDFYEDRNTAPGPGNAGEAYWSTCYLAAGDTETFTYTFTPDTTGTKQAWAQVDTEQDISDYPDVEGPVIYYVDEEEHTGCISLTIQPAEARDAGAQWRLTSGPDTAWKNSGVTVCDLPVGSYYITFKEIPGWHEPPDVNVTINKDATTEYTATYWDDLQPEATRHLPSYVSPGQEFEVTVTWTAPADDCNSIVLFDEAPDLPSDWTVEVDKTWCTPPALTEKTYDPNQAEYTWLGPYSAGTQFTAVYKVTVPADAEEGPYAFGDGSLLYFIEPHPAPPYEVSVAGDVELTVVEGSRIYGTTYEVICTELDGVTIRLYKDGVLQAETTSDGDGNYEIWAGETGLHTLVASKEGFRDETRQIDVIDFGEEYMLNFVGNHGLIPNVLDGAYFGACMSTYLFAEGECALSGPKFAAIMSAYLNPIEED